VLGRLSGGEELEMSRKDPPSRASRMKKSTKHTAFSWCSPGKTRRKNMGLGVVRRGIRCFSVLTMHKALSTGLFLITYMLLMRKPSVK
jgi:hypothetical protein